MRNIAEFQIIGNVGKVHVGDKATHVSIAANYNYRDGDDWKTEAYWNEVVLFGKAAERMTAAKGDLVRATGRMRQNSYEKDGKSIHRVDLIADGVSVLARAGNDAKD